MPPPPPLFSAGGSSGAEIAPPPEASGASTAKASPASHPRATPSGYSVPDWSGPSSEDFSLEVLKDGAIVDVVDLRGRDFVTLGRTPDNDVVLEHPSSSRLHAVVQFTQGSSDAFIFDPGSTHGTFVNKRRLKPGVHAPVFVGDQIKFGQSSRVFVVSGAVELMPEEGLSRDERRKLRALEKMSQEEQAVEINKQRQQQERKPSISNNASGATWGISDVPNDEPSELDVKLASLDWRDHDGTFSEKQQKQREKIKKKEDKINALRTENERIRAKESSSNPLSQGQQTTLHRNEQTLEKLEEEIEDADETLNESLRASISGKSQSTADKTKKKKKVSNAYDSDESCYGSDSDDGFFDRTSSAANKRRRKEEKKGFEIRNEKVTQVVETAATLWEKKNVFEASLEALTVEHDKAQKRAAEARLTTPTNTVDDLDAFMDAIGATQNAEAVEFISKQITEKTSELERVSRLLRLADPHNEFAPGSAMEQEIAKVAEMERNRVVESTAAARRKAELKAKAETEKAAKESETKRLKDWEKRGELVAKKTFAGGPEGSWGGGGAAAGQVVIAPSSVDQATSAANAQLPVGMSTAEDRRKKATEAEGTKVPDVTPATASAPQITPAPAPVTVDSDGFLAPDQLRAAHKRGASVLEIRNPKERKENGTDTSTSLVSVVEARVAEDMQLLLGGHHRFDVGEEEEFGVVKDTRGGFVAPKGQTGDGRSSLNDKLGY